MYLNTADERIPLEPGDLVVVSPARRYVIDRYLAKGGFSLLYLAHQEGSGRYVVLKEFYPLRMDDALVQRREDGKILIRNPFREDGKAGEEIYLERGRACFQTEAVLTGKAGTVFDHRGLREQQNSADVFRVEGPMEDLRGNLYLAVDTLQGESLGQFIRRGFIGEGETRSNQFLGEIIAILKQTVIRLSALHDSARIYHLDLSPDNIYLALTGGGTCRLPYIIDYGSALDAENPTGPAAHCFTVNPHSAPEVLALAEGADTGSGYEADESSDTYSLVSILFYAATGRIFRAKERLFSAGWKAQIREGYSAGMPAFHGTSSFADCLIDFFDRGLSADQADRFRTAKELLTGLEELEKRFRQYGNLLPLVHPDELMSYLVLEKHPLYRYRRADGDVHVLCLGSGVFVRRMILSMVSCGQIIGSHLHIHVVSGMGEQDFRCGLLEKAPALAEYSNLGEAPKEIYVRFTYDRVDNVLCPETCRRILEKYPGVRYLLISLGKNRLNAEAADLYAEAVSQKGNSGEEKTIINYYAAEDAANNISPLRFREKRPGWLEIDAFSEDLAGYSHTLRELGLRTLKLAHLYNRLGSAGISFEVSAEKLLKDEYSQRSSCAAALHLKYKLAGLGIDPGEKLSVQSVAEAYFQKISGDALGVLQQNEHRRWMMYMISDGYRAPTDQELEQYGFEMVDGIFNSAWKCTPRKLHPCLVPCGAGGPVLTEGDFRAFRRDDETLEAPLDELDRTSLKLNLLAREKCEIILEEGTVERLFREIRRKLTAAARQANRGGGSFPEDLEAMLESAGENLCTAVRRMERPEMGVLTRLQQTFRAWGINVDEQTEQLKQNLSMFDEYAAFKDYKAPDLAIIQNLPWVLFSQKRLTLIKLQGQTLADRITGALTLEPQKVIWVGIPENQGLIQCLTDCGIDAQVQFLPTGEEDSLTDLLEDLVLRQGGRVVIDCTGARQEAVEAAYRLCRRQPGAALMRCRGDGGLENLRNFEQAAVYTSGVSAPVRKITQQ